MLSLIRIMYDAVKEVSEGMMADWWHAAAGNRNQARTACDGVAYVRNASGDRVSRL